MGYIFTPTGKVPQLQEGFVVINTDADTSSFSAHYLESVGYFTFERMGKYKQTGNGVVEIQT